MRSTQRGKVARSAVLAFAFFGMSSKAATFVVEVADEPGKGFNDTTPADTVGGNPETTRGAQALAAFEKATSIWGATLDSPVSIRVSARFARLDCTATTGKVSSGAPHSFVHDTPGATPHVLYPIALANRLAGTDLDPSAPAIDLVFNGAAGTPGCQEGKGFYLGLDRNSNGQTDLVTAVLHEIGHGLGMTTLVDLESGALPSPSGVDADAGGAMPDIYSTLLVDERTGRHWPDMTNEERADSARAFHQLAWDGPNVTEAAKTLIAPGMPALSFESPFDKIAPAITLAPFGPALINMTPPIKGPITAVDDGMGSPQDACESPAPIAKKVAFVEAGGGCLDVQKVLSVQGAGAIAAILVNDSLGQVPLSPTGTDDTMKVKIPSLRVTQQDAAKIRQALGAAPNATIRIDSQRGLGTSVAGRVYVDATDPVEFGVSVAHWDPMVSPHMLMQPTLETSESLDLTVPLMYDLGWRPFHCGDGVAEGTEECDDGPNAGSGRCTADCKRTGEPPDGGATITDAGSDAGDGSPDASGIVGDSAPTPPPGPNRYLDAAGTQTDPNLHGIVWVPKHDGCSCRIGADETAREHPLGISGIAVGIGAFLRRRRARLDSSSLGRPDHDRPSSETKKVC